MTDKKIKLVLSYDGGLYHGWQTQQNAFTLQAVVEDGLQKILGAPVRVFASGRTDAGVHALEQVAHFTTSSTMDPETLRKGLNALLPEDILVTQAGYVPTDFHARYSVSTKVYEYRILNADAPDIFQRNYVWHIRRRLDKGEMRRCLATLAGCHDFSSFKSSGSGNRNPVRTVHRAELLSQDDGLVRITLEADGFLRHMVRNIVGTLVEVGRGKMTTARFAEVLESGDRRQAGPRAPAWGLFLVTVNY
jgi:tRNA pseudouridine38-40 synthase